VGCALGDAQHCAARARIARDLPPTASPRLTSASGAPGSASARSPAVQARTPAQLRRAGKEALDDAVFEEWKLMTAMRALP
jgi:hypothetical protein